MKNKTRIWQGRHGEMKGQIDRVHCFSAVGSALPGRAAVSKGGGVHPLKSHVSWVKYVASLVGVVFINQQAYSPFRKVDKPASQNKNHEN